jgi:hypothetical protein
MSEGMKPLATGLGALFADLERRAQETQDLTTRVRQALPGEEKDHVVSASYRDDTLIITTDSAAWGSRVRYLQDSIAESLRAQGETQFTKVRIRVGRGSP